MARPSFSLRDLEKQIDWLCISNRPFNLGNVKNKIKPDEVKVAFRSGKDEIVNRVNIRVGEDILRTLGWNTKDKICIYHHPDDLLTFRLIKSDNGSGYTLKKDTRTSCGVIDFRWKLELKLQLKKSEAVIFYTPRDEYLAFRVDM